MKRRAVTLVELLIVTTIISILAAMVMFAMATAQESARADRTRAIVGSLHSVVMARVDEYRTRRVAIESAPNESPQAFATRRLNATRLLMQAELPERWSEVADSLAAADTALAKAFAAYKITHSPDFVNQGAECLYMLVTIGDPDTASIVPATYVGDADGDGAKEFHDGWGKPIEFLRWPAGFASELQSRDAVNDHDPFDWLQQDAAAFRLVPLIYSAGADSNYHIVVNHKTVPPQFSYPASGGLLNPYATNDNGEQIGSLFSTADGWADNIHNHLIGAR